MPDQRLPTARRRNDARFKNVAATLHLIERTQRGVPKPGAHEDVAPQKLGPLQKVVAFGPLADAPTRGPSDETSRQNDRKLKA